MYLGIWPAWWHTIFEWLAYFAGYRLFKRFRLKDSIDPTSRNWVMVGCILGAALGSKIVVWLDHPAWFSANLSQPLLLATSGKGLGGGLVGGWLGVELTKRFIGLQRATGDLFVIPLLTAIIIGRIGCFIAGYYDQTYGTPTTLPWGVDFGDGILRHPTQIYEVLWLLGLLLLILWQKKYPFREGFLFRYFMIGYFAFRLLVEFIKPVPHAFFGLNGTQLLSIGVLIYYIPTIMGLLSGWKRQRSQV